MLDVRPQKNSSVAPPASLPHFFCRPCSPTPGRFRIVDTERAMKLGFRKKARRDQVPALPATDEELLRRYRRRGDRGAFAELVRRYETELYTYLQRYLGDSALAEDAFQATFLQVHLKCQQYDESRKLRPWLFTIATNQAIDAQRRNKRHRLVSLDQHNRPGGDDARTLGELAPSLTPGPAE